MKLTTFLLLASMAASTATSSHHYASTICARTNLTDANMCCSCFHSTCEMVLANCPLGTSGTNLFNYFQMQYCNLETVPWLSYGILSFWLLVVFSLLGTTADNFFVTQLETLSEGLRLSPSTAAITFLALGNSAPDVFSDIGAVQGNGDFNLAIGELVGASMFLTTVVLCAVIFYATGVKKDAASGEMLMPLQRKECKVDAVPIRDILSFFVVLAALLMFSFSDAKITTFEASLLIAAYCVYVVCVIVYTKLYTKNQENQEHRRRKSKSNVTYPAPPLLDEEAGRPITKSDLEQSLIGSSISFSYNNETIDDLDQGNDDHGDDDSDSDSDSDDEESETMIGIDWDSNATMFEKITFIMEYPFSIMRWLSIATADQKWSKRRRYIHIFVPVGCITIVFLDFSPYWTGGTPYSGFMTMSYLCSVIIGLLLGLVIFFTSNNSNSVTKWNSVFVFMAFVATVSWLDILGNECVALLESIGTFTGITETSMGHSLLGVTVLAWANSIGDFIANTAVTRAGKPEMGVSSVFASPMLTCCLGIGISVLIGSSSNGKGYVDATLDDELIISFLFLGISLMSSLIVILASDYKLPRWYGYYLLGLYTSYMILSVLVVTHTIPQWIKEPSLQDCPKILN